MSSKTPEQQAQDLAAKFEEIERQKKEAEALANILLPIIEAKDILYVGESNKYMMYEKISGWRSYEQPAIYKLLGLQKSWQKELLDEVLRAADRIKDYTTISFLETPKHVLNFLSTKDWLQPEEGSYHPIFNVLMESLSGGKQENRSHIEKCLVYKYKYPQEYKLPCITISGAGGAGKNEFVEQVLSTIFGERQVIALGTEQAFGQYNGQMIGKTIVFIDEAIVEKGDAEELKRKVGNKTISINEKYGLQGTYENTPWYWLGGNGTNGAVMLAKDVTDRRYSVLTVKHSIMYWVCKYLEIDPPAPGVVLKDSHPAVKWYFSNVKNLSNRNQVARWLHSLLEKWGDVDSVPSALHADDYEQIVDSQKNVFEETMEHVFLTPKFKHIEGKTLYRVYQAINNEAAKRQYTQNRNTFLSNARSWLEKKRPEIQWKKVKININPSINPKKLTTAHTFCIGGGTIFNRNDDLYIDVDQYGNESLVEIIVAERGIEDESILEEV